MAARKHALHESANVKEIPQRQAAEFIATYANHVEIAASIWDFRISFFEIAEDEAGNPIREKKARVVVSPQQAEAFSQALAKSVDAWKNKTAELRDVPK